MTFSHQFNPVILRAYDVRGIVGKTLSASDAYALGRAFATHVAQKNKNKSLSDICVAVAYDGRLSSIELENALVGGLKDSGIRVARVGLGPTPMLYFAVRDKGLDGGIMITGSHNPPSHNGFKMMLSKQALFGEEIQELGKIAASGECIEGEGDEIRLDVFDDYLDALESGLTSEGLNKSLKIAWDAGNGAAGEVMTRICRRLPGRHILLNEKIDGTFPAHHPDPSDPENLVQLIEVVKEQGCDVGIAFDGDGDRIGAVDGQGRIVWGDQLVSFYAKAVLAEKPGATIIADVKASQQLFDQIEEMGGKPVIWKTGHSFIKSKMAEIGADLAGEMSGHVFFADKYYGFDDGLYAAVRLIDLLMRADQTLAEMMDAYPDVANTPEFRIDVTEERKFLIVEEVAQRLRDAGKRYSDIDGVRVMEQEGWWLLRASNTQAALVARCEASDPVELEKMKAQLIEQLSLSGVSVEL